MLIAVVAIVAALTLGGLFLTIVRRRRTPQELRGDWWRRFERSFWSYVETQNRVRPHPLNRDTGLSAGRRNARPMEGDTGLSAGRDDA